MQLESSITHFLESFLNGNDDAAEPLWNNYFQRLVRLAKTRLGDSPRRMADEEDVALSAFNAFCNGVREGRFPNLTDRNNLWGLLVTITSQKCVDQMRYGQRLKRRAPHLSDPDLGQLAGREGSPEFALQVAEELEVLLCKLDASGDADLRNIALWKMEERTISEIADRLGCVRRTVERKTRLIAELWSRESTE